jgi:hypothetical protein
VSELVSTTINRDGSITVAAIYNGYRRHRQYFGYTEEEAEQMFREWLKEDKS